jgi:hypothetical protein
MIFFGKMYNFANSSGVFPVTDGYDLAVKIFKKFRQFLFGTFNHVGNFHVVKRTNNCATSDALDKTKLLPGFRGNVNSLKLMIFTCRAF